MKIAMIGATGKVGQVVAAELLRRGHQVTAISRGNHTIDGVETRISDINTDPDLAAKLGGHDVVISSVRFVEFDQDRLIDTVAKSGVDRYVVVGGAGSLTHPEGGLIWSNPKFPEAARENSRMGAVYLDKLQDSALNWTFLSPAMLFFDGPATGNFRLGRDDALVGPDGKSSVSYGDVAVAQVDELEKPQHERQRFTVGY